LWLTNELPGWVLLSECFLELENTDGGPGGLRVFVNGNRKGESTKYRAITTGRCAPVGIAEVILSGIPSASLLRFVGEFVPLMCALILCGASRLFRTMSPLRLVSRLRLLIDGSVSSPPTVIGETPIRL
jgi:hypothetical protein